MLLRQKTKGDEVCAPLTPPPHNLPMFAFASKPASKSTTSSVTYVAAGMFIYFTLIRVTPWVVKKVRGA